MTDIKIIVTCPPPPDESNAGISIGALFDAITTNTVMIDEARDKKGRRCYLISYPVQGAEFNGMSGMQANFIGVIYDVPVAELLKEIKPVTTTLAGEDLPGVVMPGNKTYN